VTNTTVPRAILASLEETVTYQFVGFPRQWLPFFVWFGLQWRGSVPPSPYIPFYSDLSERDLMAIIANCERDGTLRTLVESTTVHDAILADCLYIVDQRRRLSQPVVASDLSNGVSNGLARRKTISLNGWQSYGRPCVRRLEDSAQAIPAKSPNAIVLPCALRRPYQESQTHRKLYRILYSKGISVEAFDKIVMTSIGILPEGVWNEPVVIGYVAGVPDIYRLLRLGRTFFATHRYELVVDCLQFEPYSDVLRVIHREGLIRNLRKVRIRGRRPFYVRSRPKSARMDKLSEA
jgi:hypothetical protein